MVMDFISYVKKKNIKKKTSLDLLEDTIPVIDIIFFLFLFFLFFYKKKIIINYHQ